jgi:predicted short-subunit dehydrogenase-like oxidoreductase (DUF2520 family)
MSALSRVAIVGIGRLGSLLARTLRNAGVEIGGFSGRSYGTLHLDAPVVFLTVPDGSIPQIAGQIAWQPGQVAVHCSGALGLGVLDAARAAGALRASLHPFQTIASRDEPSSVLAGAAAVIEADPDAESAIRELASLLGVRPITLPPGARTSYHAAGSIASNYLVTLWATAATVLAAAGFAAEDIPALLGPLMRTTLDNLERRGPAVLTGPISRGDTGTVARHLEALPAESLGLYAALGAATADLAARLGRIDVSTARQIQHQLAAAHDHAPVATGRTEEGSS